MKILKWLAIIAAALVAVLLIAVAAVYLLSNRNMAATYEVTPRPVTILTDSASLARGRHVARAIAKCVHCHGEDFSGTSFIDAPAFARVPAPNLTRGRGGIGASYADVDWARSIRHGVLPSGRGAIIMPAEAYRYLSDEDLGAVIGYVRSVPPVDREWPGPKLGPIGRTLLAFNALPVFPAATMDHSLNDVPAAPARDTTPAYGGYLARVGGCAICHGQTYSGGSSGPGSPPDARLSANLTPGGIGEWTEATFVRVLREGEAADGHDIDNEQMPWRYTSELTDAEIHALWLFLRSLPPKAFGEP